jgi:hypothetical protein
MGPVSANPPDRRREEDCGIYPFLRVSSCMTLSQMGSR